MPTFAAAIGLWLAACDRQPAVQPNLPDAAASPLASVVAGDAASALTPDGRFARAGASPSRDGEITGERATQLATAFIKTFARFIQSDLDKRHGARVNLAALTPCGRTFYAQSPYETPSAGTPALLKRLAGAWWLVPYCGAGPRPTVVITVSALNTGIDIRSDGTLQLPYPAENSVTGHEFGWDAVPRGTRPALAVEPELAVTRAAQASGRRVIAEPSLFVPAAGAGIPSHARWRVRLDGTVRVKTRDGQSLTVSELYVGPGNGKETGEIAVALLDQPANEKFPYDVIDTTTRPIGPEPMIKIVGRNEYVIGRRSATPLTLRSVSSLGDTP